MEWNDLFSEQRIIDPFFCFDQMNYTVRPATLVWGITHYLDKTNWESFHKSTIIVVCKHIAKPIDMGAIYGEQQLIQQW